MKLILVLLMLLPMSAFAELNNCRITAQTFVGALNTTIKALSLKGNRRCLTVQNNSLGTTTVYLKFGPATGGFSTITGLSLSAGTIWSPIVIPMNDIYVSTNSSVGTSTMFIEGE